MNFDSLIKHGVQILFNYQGILFFIYLRVYTE